MILEAVEWAKKEEGYESSVPAIARQSVKEPPTAIHSNRSHHEKAGPSVREATHAREMAGQTKHSKNLETAEASAAKQGQINEKERHQQEAVEKEVTQQSNNPPLDDTEWKYHVRNRRLPVIRYIMTRF
jgi:hypothetical protein